MDFVLDVLPCTVVHTVVVLEGSRLFILAYTNEHLNNLWGKVVTMRSIKPKVPIPITLFLGIR